VTLALSVEIGDVYMGKNQLMNGGQLVLYKGRARKEVTGRQQGRTANSVLFEKYKSVIKKSSVFKREDVSFQGNKKLPFYRWFPYKEGFSFDMVDKILKGSGLKGGNVLDPFAGSGTTLFASRENGFNSYGIEIMPIGMEIYRARNAVESTNSRTIKDYIREIKKINFEDMPVSKEFEFQHLTITKGAFPEINERCLNAFRTYINTRIKDSKVKTIFNFVGMCLLEKISYTSKDGQFLRWDVRAGKGRGKYTKNKIYGFDEALREFLNQMLNDLNTLPTSYKHEAVETNLENANAFEKMPDIPKNSYDLIISSPPYCNRYDYTRTYALELAYLGVDETKLKELRHNMLTSTVEGKGKVSELKNMYLKRYGMNELSKIEETFNSCEDLHYILKRLEFYKKTKQLNNPGIYKMVFNYFYEHAFIIYEMQRVLKHGGHLYYVNDNVRYSDVEIPVDLILAEFADKLGFDISEIFVISEKKGNSSQQMAKYGKADLRKCVYHWVKR